MFVMNNNYPITRALLKLNHFYLTPSDLYQRTTSAGPILDLISIRLSDVPDPIQKRMTFLHFFSIFFSKCHILWNAVANIKKKKVHVRNRLNFWKNQVYWVIMWLCRSIFIAWKNAFNFCVVNFYLIYS